MTCATFSLGMRLRSQRRALCLTQTQLADQIGVDQSAIARWEADQIVPALRHRQRIAAALGTHPQILFQGDN